MSLLDIDHECAICLQLVCNPVQWPTGCGHAYCQLCVWRCLQSKQNACCPLCRSPAEGDAPALPTDLMVDVEHAQCIASCYPTLYASRLASNGLACDRISANVVRIALVRLEHTAKARPRVREGHTLKMVVRKPAYLRAILNALEGCQIGVVVGNSPSAGMKGNLVSFSSGWSPRLRIMRKPLSDWTPLTASEVIGALENGGALRTTMHVGKQFVLLTGQQPVYYGNGEIVHVELSHS